MSELVSVIIPVYNTAETLDQCILSIIDQTYHNLEIILVNDGSSDKSGIICDNYIEVDSRINVLHKDNGGLSSARNAGIDISTGEYLCFVDSDDYISENMIESLLNLVKRYECKIADCGYIDITLDKRRIKSEIGNGIEYGNGYFMLERFLNENIFNGVVTKMFHHSLFESTRFPVGRIYEEIYLTLYFALEKPSYVHTDEAFYIYKHRENSILRSKFTHLKAREYIYILENMIALIRHKILEEEHRNHACKILYERNASAFLALALNNDRIIRRIYSKLYLKRLKLSVKDCFMSQRISFKNKVTFILCKLGFSEVVYILKKISLKVSSIL